MTCTHHAHTVHAPCTHRAHTVHAPCTHRARTVHAPCPCAHEAEVLATRMPCTHHTECIHHTVARPLWKPVRARRRAAPRGWLRRGGCGACNATPRRQAAAWARYPGARPRRRLVRDPPLAAPHRAAGALRGPADSGVYSSRNVRGKRAAYALHICFVHTQALSVTLADGSHVSGSPLALTIAPGSIAPARCVAVGEGLRHAVMRSVGRAVGGLGGALPTQLAAPLAPNTPAG